MNFFKKFPIVGILFQCKGAHFCEALKESIFVWIISTLPLIFSIFGEMIFGSPLSEVETYSSIFKAALLSNLKAGEVFIYTTAFLAPVAYTLYTYNRTGKKFGEFWIYVLLIILIIAGSSFIFGYYRSGETPRDPVFFLKLGAGIYTLSLVLWFFSLIHELMLINYDEINGEQILDLRSRIRRLRSQS